MFNSLPVHPPPPLFMLLLIMTTHFHSDLKCQMNGDEHAEAFNLILVFLRLLFSAFNNSKLKCGIKKQTDRTEDLILL